MLTEQEIASFEQLGVDLELKLNSGDVVYLVKERTEQKRNEVTLDDVRRMATILQAFPGSHVSKFVPAGTQTAELGRPPAGGAGGLAPLTAAPAPQPAARKNRYDEAWDGSWISVSIIKTFEQCPAQFDLKFRQNKAVAGPEKKSAPALGTLVHHVCEHLVREHVENERTGPLSYERGKALWQQFWEQSGLTGLEMYADGANLVEAFIRDQAELDSRDVLDLEVEFELVIDGVRITGTIDRVDQVDPTTIEVIDYKTNRQLWSGEELDHDLQLAVYWTAAKRRWPWAQRIKLTYWMLRHGVRQPVERDEATAAAALEYLVTTGRAALQAEKYEPKLSPLCGWCAVREHCQAYQKVLKEHPDFGAIPEDLEDVGRERELVAASISILNKRKKDLESKIREALKGEETVELAGVEYSLLQTRTQTYPVEDTLSVLSRMAGVDALAVRERLLSVDKDALKELLDELKGTLSKAQLNLLKVELEAIAVITHGTRFNARALTKQRSAA